MIKQTIALFRYQLLGIINIKIVLILCIVFVVAFLLSRFVAELAIINSETISLGVMADFLRYSLILMLIISISYQISQDYELSQFERLLAMPVSRSQYVLAQFFVLLTFSGFLVLPVFFLMFFLNDFSLALYWTSALFLEMILIGQFAILAILSLEKLPVAVIFALASYLLAKAVPFIDLIFSQSMTFYNEDSSFQIGSVLFSIIKYVLPDSSAFAQNNVIFDAVGQWSLLLKQLITVLMYGLFIQFVILIDFYRKEFNQT